MKKITTFTNIWEIKNIPQYIADSMYKQMLKLCKDYLTLDISTFGAFFYVENKSDLDNYIETGITERIEDAEPEWINIFSSPDKTKNCMQGCYLLHTNYAIYIFCETDTIKLKDCQDTQNKP